MIADDHTIVAGAYTTVAGGAFDAADLVRLIELLELGKNHRDGAAILRRAFRERLSVEETVHLFALGTPRNRPALRVIRRLSPDETEPEHAS